MSTARTTGPRRSSAPRRLALAVLFVTAVAASLLAFVVADHASGRPAAVASSIAIVLLPLGLGVVVERVLGWAGREARAEIVALFMGPLVFVGWMVIACVPLARATGHALYAVPDRFAWTRGFVGDVARRAGLALAPDAKERSSPQSAPPRAEALPIASVSATVSASPASPRTAPPSGTASPGAPSSAPVPELFSSYREDDDCATLADVSAIAKGHAPGKLRATAEALAAARYPAGVPYLQAQDDKQLSVWFQGAPDTFEGVASRLDTAIHEGAHMWGFKRFNGRTQTYPVRRDLTIEIKLLKNFDRSEILGRHVDAASDSYEKTYLEGRSGAQGFNTLLDEYNAYVHSLAAAYCLRDLKPPNIRTSARDGILTFMYYVETYLAIGRAAHPADYTAILGDPGHRRLILTVWQRAEHFLKKSEGDRSLGIHDDVIRGWVYDRARLDEIERVRAADGPR